MFFCPYDLIHVSKLCYVVLWIGMIYNIKAFFFRAMDPIRTQKQIHSTGCKYMAEGICVSILYSRVVCIVAHTETYFVRRYLLIRVKSLRFKHTSSLGKV